MIKSYKREPTFRQYSNDGFGEKLAHFYQFIKDFTYIDEELNPEERAQLLQSRFTNGEMGAEHLILNVSLPCLLDSHPWDLEGCDVCYLALPFRFFSLSINIL